MQRGHILVPLALVEIIAVLGQAIGVDNAEVGGLRRARPSTNSATAGADPGRGLADVVKASPDKFAGGVVVGDGAPPSIAGNGAPAHGALIIRSEEIVTLLAISVACLAVINPAAIDGRSCLRVVYQPVISCSAVKVANGGIVVAHNATIVCNHLCNLVGSTIIVFKLVIAKCRRTGDVNFLDPSNQITGDYRIIVCIAADAFQNLVAQAVHDDGRRILILVDHGLDIKFCPGHVGFTAENGVVIVDGNIKPLGIVVGISVFGVSPRIKGLVNEHNALLIGNFNEFRRGGVVGNADGVAAHLLEDLHLPLDGAIPCLRAKRSLVVVHTDAFELGGLAVEFKAIGAVKICPTEAELGLAGVYHRITHQNFRLQRIESGRIRRPEGGILNLGSLRNLRRCTGLQTGSVSCGH